MNDSSGPVIKVPVGEIIIPPEMPIPKIHPKILGIFRAKGIEKPLMISPYRTLIDGIKRLTAARALGMETVPCVVQQLDQIFPARTPSAGAGSPVVRAHAPDGWCSRAGPPGTTRCRRQFCVDEKGLQCPYFGVVL